MRYVGQGHELDVPALPGDDGAALRTRVSALHAVRNGFTLDAPVELIGVRHVASGPAHPISFARDPADQSTTRLTGPAVVTLAGATLRIADGWIAEPHATGGWRLTRAEDRP